MVPLANFEVTRHLRLDVGGASWGCSDRSGGSCFAYLPRGCETAVMSVLRSHARPGGWSYACIAGHFRMSRCRWDIVKLRWAGLITRQRLARGPGQIGQSRAENRLPSHLITSRNASRKGHPG